MRRLGLYWHTLRHLRPGQVFGRVRFRLAKPVPDLRPAPPIRSAVGDRWIAPAQHHATLAGPERFRLLGETRALPDHGWDDPAVSKLWRYNLHYFDDLTAVAANDRLAWHRSLLSRWVAENPPAVGTGWEPYPTSLRIVNWIKWAWAGHALSPDCVSSLAVQARWLSRRLEIHLRGNHLFANAKALVFAGMYFDGPEADTWRERGLALLAREIPEQILADGGQFERSPMYHALALEDMLDLFNLARVGDQAIPVRRRSMVAEWPTRIAAMRHWLSAMCHPDGEIGFFNDAAIGVAPSRARLEAYANRLGLGDAPALAPGITTLEPSGYLRVECGPVVALLDVAPVGPDYLPGHAHADTLSFELSLFGCRVVVNSGTSRYGDDPARWWERSTAAHNTVVVDGMDSSEVWGGFRVARRAYPVGLAVTQENGIVVRCAHDGYGRLPGRPMHERRWTFDASGLTVDDRVTGRFAQAEARFHLHPDVVVPQTVALADGLAHCALRLAGGQSVRIAVEAARMWIEPAHWHPRFGADVPNFCVVVALRDGRARTRIDWGEGG